MLGDGVQVRRSDVTRRGHAGLAGTGAQGRENGRALLPVVRDDLIKGLDPLSDLCGQVLFYGFLELDCHGVVIPSVHCG